MDNIRNIIQGVLQDEKKKKILIIGIAIFLLIIGTIFFLTRNSNGPQDDSQLLSDIAGLAPRDTLLNRNFQLSPTIELSAEPAAIAPGQTSKISWVSSNATNCVDGNGDTINLEGDRSVSPTEPYTFEVSCVGPKGTEIQSITVIVTTAPIINLVATPKSVIPGAQSLISWNTVNADRCVDSASSTLRLSGSMFVSPKKPYTFSMSCVGPKGTSVKSVTVTIAAAPPKYVKKPTSPSRGSTPVYDTPTIIVGPPDLEDPPTPAGKAKITLSASPLRVKYGEPSVISWQTEGATNCTGTTPTGLEMFNPDTNESIILQPGYPPIPLPENGKMSIRVLGDKTIATLTVKCFGADGTITERSITVRSDPRIPGACEGTIRPTFTSFSALPTVVENPGDPSVVTWNSKCATSCVATVVPNGDLITYPDTSTIPDYVEGQDYNKYTPTNGIPNLAVNTTGGIRIRPGAGDKKPSIIDRLCAIGDYCTSSSKSTASVTVKCTNVNTGFSITKSVTVGITPKKGKCKNFFCKLYAAVLTVAAITTVPGVAPAAQQSL
ncbi:MAG: hypothetical protein AAB770_01055 [Patescibacteria group bacterium]